MRILKFILIGLFSWIFLIVFTILFFVVVVFGMIEMSRSNDSSPAPKTEVKVKDDEEFLKKNKAEIENQIIETLDPSHEHLKSITIRTNTAKGEYDNGGDVGGIYHIYFKAYANDDKSYKLNGEIYFPDAGIPPFTFIHPNPYKDEDQDMSNWGVDVEHGDSDQWQWKINQEKEEEQREEAESKAKQEALAAENQRLKDLYFPKITSWTLQHNPGLIEAFNKILDYGKDNDDVKKLGKLERVEAVDARGISEYTSDTSGYASVTYGLYFENYPNDRVTFTAKTWYDDFTFQDMSKGGSLSMYQENVCRFEILDRNSAAYKDIGLSFTIQYDDEGENSTIIIN